MGQHTRLDGGNTPAKLKRLKKFKNRNLTQGRKTLGKRTILSSRALLWDATGNSFWQKCQRKSAQATLDARYDLAR